MKEKNSIQGISLYNDLPVSITYDDEGIVAIARIEEKKDLPYISYGFLDMQVNGYRGFDYSLEDFKTSDVKTLITHLAESGTTCHVPTFVSMPHERLLKNLKRVRRAMKEDPFVAASIPAFHIEGPFISPIEGPRGVHDPTFIRHVTFSEFLEWQDAADGHIGYVTLAPEEEGALDFIKKVVATGVKVAIGHSGAAPEIIHEAIKAGATLSTHLGNGSYTQIPRLKNYIWEQLAADELTAGIICDSYHLPGSVVKVFARAKGLDRLILVSDVALLGGFPPGLHKWGNMDIDVHEDGHLGLHGTSVLAGAAHLLDWDIVKFMNFTGSTLKDAIRLCTVNPAKALGLNVAHYSDFTVGNPANFCVFKYNKGAERLQILKTIQQGTCSFTAK